MRGGALVKLVKSSWRSQQIRYFQEIILALQVCTQGRRLTSHQAALLRHLQIKMAVFRLGLRASVTGDRDAPKYDEICLDDSDDEDEDAMSDVEFADGLPTSMMLPEVLPQG
jgi:hypothetical protein